MQNSAISWYQSEPLIIDQEDDVPASTVTCQLDITHCEAERSCTHKDQSEPSPTRGRQGIFGSKNFNTKSSDWEGIFTAVTPRQVQAVSEVIIRDVLPITLAK